MASPLLHEKIWFEKNAYDEAERQYYEKLIKLQTLGQIKFNNPKMDCNKKAISSINNKNINGIRKEDETVKVTASPKPTPSPEIFKSTSATTPTSNSTPIIEDLQPEIPLKEICVISAPGTNPTPNTEKRFKQKEYKEKRKERKRDNKDKKSNNKDEQKGTPNNPLKSSLAGEVAKVRQHIKTSLECMDGLEALAKNNNIELNNRVNSLEKENADLKKLLNDLQGLVKKLDSRVKTLETSTPKVPSGAPNPSAAKPALAPTKPNQNEEDEDDDVDLFGSDSEEESEEAKRVKEARLAAYHEKKSKKPVLIAKSNIILDVKPWDDETDMKQLEAEVRKIEIDGLLWGASKLVPLAYGIHKLQISCVVEDDKVSVDLLQENIEGIEDYVQSVDIAAFNKV